MGVDTRRPILPAPTESLVDTNTTIAGSIAGTDLATDLSRRTDKSFYSIPDDGSPITIPTRRRHRSRGDDDSKLSRSSHQHSQTSLLIEYFEGGKGSGSGSGSGSLVARPSVRVRVTPSSARKSKDHRDRDRDHHHHSRDHHIQITESSAGRKPVYSRRISLSSPHRHHKASRPESDDQGYSSNNSATDENQPPGPPVEIELMNRDQASELSTLSRDTRYFHPTSDISSMPADSMLEAPSSGPRRKRSQSLERDPSIEKEYLKTPRRQRSRSLSTERIAHRVAEKLSNDPREVSRQRRRAERSRFDDSDPQEMDTKSPRRRGTEDVMSPESSLLSASAVSSHRRSGDQYSFKSGTSKSSINNPKLLETVEDAIRRLILPELKELKKDQKVISNTSKFDRDMNASYSSASTPSRDELGRRLSKHASAPDVRKPKVVLNKDSRDEGILLSGDSVPSHKERRSSKDSERYSEKGPEIGYIKWGYRPEMTEQEKLRRQKSKGLRDAEKAALVGNALTAAALHHHDSRSSLDKSEGRRRSSGGGGGGGGGHSRTGSINETELVFQKHNIAPMPLRSAIESDLTRASLLSEQTAAASTWYDEDRAQEVSRAPPFQALSPTPRTPNRTPLDARYELRLKHSNLSSHDLSIHSPSSSTRSPVGEAAGSAIAAAAAANLLDIHSDHHDLSFSDLGSRRRTLSPIQSVASYQSQSPVKQEAHHDRYEYSEDERELEPRLSIDSLSSAPSTNLARSTRPEGLSITSQTESLRRQQQEYPGPELGYEETPRPSPRDDKHWDESEDEEHDYRHSMAESTGTERQRMTGYTDESEMDYRDMVDQGHHVEGGTAANPQFVHPMAVESAVASLLDPTVLDQTVLDSQSGANRSMNDIPEQDESEEELDDITPQPSRQGSPLKQRQDAPSPDAPSPDATSFPRRMGATSPPQSVTQSLEDLTEPALFSGVDRESPMPHDEGSPDSESEINTNPSIIQGPAAQEHSWGFNRTPSKDAPSPLFDKSGAGAGLGLGSVEQPKYGDYYEDNYGNYGDTYGANDYGANDYFDQDYPRQMLGTPLGAKDEGYVSAANPRSPSVETPEPLSKGIAGIDTNGMGMFDSPIGGDDSFMPSHQRQLSGFSHGVPSPLYDSATGKGIDRIKSKDIVALMDHLTVRDAQRNARDTEILVTLVRSAAEMRNSFEEMKKFIAQQDGAIMDANDRQHERTHRALGGPRPLPVSARSARQMSVDEGEDMRSKRKNIFKRALKGLSLKNSSDLGRIEDMLEQLLDEVEALRLNQDDKYVRAPRAASVDPEGYEPEGQAGTSSPGNQSEYLSTSSQPAQEPLIGNGLRRGMENRVSTVPELDEDLDVDERGEFLSPPLPSQEANRQDRAGSAPTEKAKKHKSSSSSFFPKISRWSKTTASSMGDNIRNSIQPGRKERASFEASRSGSDFAGAYNKPDFYDQGDGLRSTYTLEDQAQENRPPSPLVPSQASEVPKYQAHRGSLDLFHPQPRQGPSGRYQSQLETQAQGYTMPGSGAPSEQWGSNPSLSGVNANQRYSGGSRLSPISDAGYSEASSRHTGPPRPPKVKDDGPLIPERPLKAKEDDERSYVERVASRSSAMRSPRSTPPPARKPTGPRPLTSGSQFSPARRKHSQYRASPDQVDAELDY
ncbi:hypothetical protein BO70DRAFT_394227 [Aspergillus heteromorphus CBS 117.55]|uniref:Uncharacterized protein n=1 Tax=Aspergillus heteromorphus CBS 117.55 TaxID=1448321 RepID=A0A317WTL5_9EURO|nr:uncharacterized protein BO70DRAFT_394227 [Aspergillus heteromorphus CBS 117.55]PWY88527.1 hypothetical protein BO70DRAFT_394227 [Aspergillus heteromorphus CBS 117.55]